MANWGTYDYSQGSAEQLEIDAAAEGLRTQLRAAGKADAFLHNDKVARGYNQSLVQVHCVRNEEWQKVRLSMKGVDTSEKLAILHAWWEKHHNQAMTSMGQDICEIQVGNYLGALRRGGQLDDLNRVRRAR